MSNLLYDTLFGCHVENDKPFLTYYDGSQISYDAFLRMASRFANVIKAAGLVAGDKDDNPGGEVCQQVLRCGSRN